MFHDFSSSDLQYLSVAILAQGLGSNACALGYICAVILRSAVEADAKALEAFSFSYGIEWHCTKGLLGMQVQGSGKVLDLHQQSLQ